MYNPKRELNQELKQNFGVVSDRKFRVSVVFFVVMGKTKLGFVAYYADERS